MIDDFDYSALTEDNLGDNEIHVKGRKVYDGNSWFITLRLSDFFDARYEKLEDPMTGEDELCVCIPIRKNGILYTKRRNAVITVKATLAQKPSNRYTHLITMLLDDEQEALMKQCGFYKPFIGHMRPKNFKKTTIKRQKKQ